MLETTAILGLMCMVTGVLVAVLCYPLLLGKIKLNHWYGFRFAKSYESEEAWYVVNRYGARQMIAWCAPLAAFGAVILTWPPAPGSMMFWIAVVAPMVLLVPCYTTWRWARRL